MTAPTTKLDGAMTLSQELIDLLREIRPSFSDVGSRDVDTRRKQNQIDRALELLSASKPAVAHDLLAMLIDVYDDGQNNAPEDRCYVEGTWKEVLSEARSYLAASPAAPAQSPKSCQTGWGDICHMAKHDGVVCPDDSCDIDDGVRAAPVQSGEPVAYVPVHPRSGPLWANTVPTLDADRPRHYEVWPVYFAPQPSQPAQSGEQGIMPPDGDKEHCRRLYMQERACRQQWQQAFDPLARMASGPELLERLAPPQATATRTHTTQAGESVAGIALRNLGNENEWRSILECNPEWLHLSAPDYFPVGTVLTLPAAPQPSPTAVEVSNVKRFPAPISISTDKICEIAGKYNLGNLRLDALRGFVNEVIIVNEAEYAKSE